MTVGGVCIQLAGRSAGWDFECRSKSAPTELSVDGIHTGVTPFDVMGQTLAFQRTAAHANRGHVPGASDVGGSELGALSQLLLLSFQ